MSDSVVFEKIFSSQSDRGNYTYSKGYLSYFIALIGVHDKDLYNLELYKANKSMINRSDIILFEENIPNPNDFDIINYFKGKLANYKSYVKDINVSLIKDEVLNNRIKDAFDKFLYENSSEFANDRVKQNFIIKLMSWIRIYLNKFDLQKDQSPKIVFYGDIKKHEAYLLMILYYSGFDILYINPNNDSLSDFLNYEKYEIEINENIIIEERLTFEERTYNGEMVEKSSIKKAVTVGAQASKKISDELLNESGFIKPWQLQDRSIKSLILNSTLEEISIYWNQPTKLRPGFTFDSDVVDIPVFFSKINGVYNNSDEYLNLIDTLKAPDSSYFIKSSGNIEEFSKEFTREAFNLSFAVNTNGRIDKKSLINEDDYSISILNINQKNMILEKVEEIIFSDIFMDGLSKEDMIKGLFTVLNMNTRFVHMINNFDYSSINPKLVIYMDKSFIFSKECVFLLLLLSKIGFDIVIISPGGDNCIENIINSQIIDSHRLDKMIFDFNLSKLRDDESIFKKIFGRKRWI